MTTHVVHFQGPTGGPPAERLRDICLQALGQGATAIRIHFSSGGGGTGDGFMLYHFLRSLPVPVVIHNIGNVESMAIVVFYCTRCTGDSMREASITLDFVSTFHRLTTILNVTPQYLKNAQRALIPQFRFGRTCRVLRRYLWVPRRFMLGSRTKYKMPSLRRNGLGGGCQHPSHTPNNSLERTREG
jgi:hypothetical protein